ncbi:MAG: DNA polymerase III subunit gamma/tau [Caldilineales bacterium]
MAQVLYRKWRSQTFDEVVGQEHVTQTLRNALRDGRTAHAYLFTGPRGTGKTSTARLLAKAVNCLDPDPAQRPDNTCTICQSISNGSLLDLIEIDAASNRGIDEIRDLRDRVHFAPSQARYKVYVIDEVHMLTPEAFNALLKTLEEPPPHVIFVLATTEPHKIPDTVLSRCQRFDFRRIPPYKVAGWLAYILEQEGRSAEPAALEMIARSTEGSMRDAISLTDQLLSYGDAVITEAQVRAVRGAISSVAIAALVDELVAGDASGGLATINQMVAEGIDLRQLAIQLVAHLRAVLLCQVNAEQARELLTDLSDEQLAVAQTQAAESSRAATMQALRLFNQASLDIRTATQPQLVLEMAWLDALEPPAPPAPVQSSAAAIARPSAAAPADLKISGTMPAGERRPEEFASTGDADAPASGQPLPRPIQPVPDADVVEVLRANWTTLLQAAETARGPQLRGALRTLRNVVASGSDIHFAFERDFAKNVVEKPANRQCVEDLIGQLLGRRVHVHCQVGSQVTGVAETQPAPATPRPAAETPAETDLEQDPVALHAKQELGAVASKLSAG